MLIAVYYSSKGTPYVIASSLHDQMQINTPLSKWFPRMIEYGFTLDKDFSSLDKFVDSANGIKKRVLDWAVTIDMAKNIAMIQRTPQGKAIREYLLHLDQKVTEGELLNQGQIMALMDICKVMGYFSVQKFFEDEHYKKVLKERDFDWWERRARLFGYGADELKKALFDLGIKYKSQRQAMFFTDRYELIRTGVVEMFIVMGKSIAFAKNVGNIAKEIAQQLKPEIYDDIDTLLDFKSEQENLIITDLKNYKVNSLLFKRFTGGKQNPQVPPDYNQLNLGLSSKTDGNT